MENYQPNSYKFKEEQKKSLEKKKVEKIVKGKVKVNKRSVFSKWIGMFMADDVNATKSHILFDVVIPSVKNIISSTIDIIFDIEPKSNKRNSSKISYRDYYEKDDRSNVSYYRPNSVYNVDSVVLSTRGDAEEILLNMDELIETYGMASVADFYDLLGVTVSYTDNNYGWMDLRNARVIRVKDGYKIDLPRVKPLK